MRFLSRLPEERRFGLYLLAALAVFFGALQNGQWAPVSDADLYVAVGRNLASGDGFVYNGWAVRRIPPGWPLLLAALMKVSESFWFLNLFQMGLFLATALLYYRVLLRQTTPALAFAACLATGMLSHWFHRTFMLHSEGVFSLMAALAILLALQIAEGRRAAWRIPLYLAICTAAPFIRWQGPLIAGLAGAAMLTGRLRPRLDRQWTSCVLGIALSLVSFFALRHHLNEEATPSAPVVADADEAEDTPSRTYAIGVKEKAAILTKLAASGGWLSALLCEPLQLGRKYAAVGVAGMAAGWMLLAVFLCAVALSMKTRRWLLLGALLYCLPLFYRWPYPAPRYLVPVTPLLLLGIIEGYRWASTRNSSGLLGKAIRIAAYSALAGAGACNMSLYAVDLWILHSEDFYGAYFDGQGKALMTIADHMKSQGLKDYEVAVGELVKQNPSPSQARSFGRRGLYFLTGRNYLLVPPSVCSGPPDDALMEWARVRGIRYYIYRPPVNPWRVWHFRVPAWIQEAVSGRPVGAPTPYYELYEVSGERPRRIEPPEPQARMPRVPSM